MMMNYLELSNSIACLSIFLSHIYVISFFTIILDYSQGLVYIEQKFGFELVIDRTRTCKIYFDKKKEKAKVERFLKYALCNSLAPGSYLQTTSMWCL